jgi:hypothetical protein
MAEASEKQEQDVEISEVQHALAREGELSSWVFVNRQPTPEDVIGLLLELPDQWGLTVAAYVDYVQPLPQNQRVKVAHPTNPNVKVDVQVQTWTLYMTVAGRIRMINDAAQKNGWVVSFVPEKKTATGVPGMLQMGDGRIVYREYVEIRDVSTGQLVGRKPGMAWVPYSGGNQAAGSNPYEKVETAARGRAIAAWGIGILPGSGVASLEEMRQVRENRDALQSGQQPRERGNGRQSREELLQDTLVALERLRQARGISEDEAVGKTAAYLTKIGVQEPLVDGQIQWDKVKSGQLVLLRNETVKALQALADAESEV